MKGNSVTTTPPTPVAVDTYADSASAELRDQFGLHTDDDLARLRRVRDNLVAATIQSEWLEMRLSIYEEFFEPVLELIDELDDVLDIVEGEELWEADDDEDAHNLP